MDFTPVLVAFNLSAAQTAVYALLPVLTMGVTTVFKRAGAPDALLPLIAVAMGVLFSMLVLLMLPDPPINAAAGILLGIIAGLMASGIWSGGKTIGRALK